MKFTEREMTVGIDQVARGSVGGGRGLFRKKDAAAAWETLAPFEKYQRRAAVGEAVIPALIALPERPTVGATPEFTGDEYAEAATTAMRDQVERQSPGGWDELSEKQRTFLVQSTAALTRAVVEAMPLRQDPDAILSADDFTVPDSLDGLI